MPVSNLIKNLTTQFANRMSGPPTVKDYVYTCILGQYDDLPTFDVLSDKIQPVCFTDTPDAFSDPGPWKMVTLPVAFQDPKIMNGYMKSISHLLFGTNARSVWIDGSLRDVKLDDNSITHELGGSSIAVPPHLVRTTVQEEMFVVEEAGLELPDTVKRLGEHLRATAFPDDRALSATMMVFRDHRDPRLCDANLLWSQLITSGIRRDQLTFDHCLWACGLSPKHLDIDWQKPNRLFNRVPHLNDTPRQATATNSISNRGAGLSFPPMPEFYPSVDYYPETTPHREADMHRALNAIVANTTVDGEVEGNYCHLNKSRISEFTPADPRRAWKREYLRHAVRGARRVIEVGFNAGHSAALMLEAEPAATMVSIDIADHAYVMPCAVHLHQAYDPRFRFLSGDSREVLPTLDVAPFDFFHVDGGHQAEVFAAELSFFLANAGAGTRLLVDDAYVPWIKEELDKAIDQGALAVLDCVMASSGENQLFVKTGAEPRVFRSPADVQSL